MSLKRLNDIISVNYRYYVRKLKERGLAVDVSIFANLRYRLLHIPKWDKEYVQLLQSPESQVSRLLGMNNSAVEDAERILSGEYRIFDKIDVAEDTLPDWNMDWYSKQRFTLIPFTLIQIEANAGRDIIVPWEISRIQFVPTLIQAYRETGDKRYADYFVRLLHDFKIKNPYLRGVNWFCGMDVAIRALQIALGLIYFAEALGEDELEIRRLLWAHVVYVQRYDLEEKRTTVNNHFLVSAALQYILLHLFQDGVSNGWQSRALYVVEEQLLRQFRSDGGNFESATQYHQFVLEALLVMQVFTGQDTYALLNQRLTDALRFAADCKLACGEAPNMGDSSDGRILVHRRYYDGNAKEADYLGDLAEVLYGNQNPYSQVEFQGVKPHYRETGLGLYRDIQYGACLCAMPVDENAGGHNHSDKAALLLSVSGQPVIVDAGTYCYTSDTSARRRFREGAAHNILMLDGKDPAEYASDGAFEKPQYCEIGLTMETENGKQVWQAWHDGYCRVEGVGRVTRKMKCMQGRLELNDQVEGWGVHNLELLFHFHPDLNVRLESNVIEVSSVEQLLCRLQLSDDLCVHTEEYNYSPAYMKSMKAVRVVAAGQVQLPVKLHTKILFE